MQNILTRSIRSLASSASRTFTRSMACCNLSSVESKARPHSKDSLASEYLPATSSSSPFVRKA